MAFATSPSIADRSTLFDPCVVELGVELFAGDSLADLLVLGRVDPVGATGGEVSPTATEAEGESVFVPKG